MVTFTASAPPALLRISEIFVIVLPVAGTLEERIVEAVFPSAWNVNLVGLPVLRTELSALFAVVKMPVISAEVSPNLPKSRTAL